MEKPPRRAVTIKDIGERLGMSHSTVSRALGGHKEISAETKARVQAAAAELGYVPNMSARAIRGDAVPTLGLAIPEIANELYSRIAKEFADRCGETNSRMMLILTDDDPDREYREIRALAEARVSGMAVALTGSPLPATIKLLSNQPTIQIVRKLDAVDLPALCLDERAGCADAVDHLVSIGHRRIAYIGTDGRVSSGRERIEAYLAAHARHGIAPLGGGMLLGQPQERFGYDGIRQLLDLPDRPTALIIATSRLLIGALSALRDAKIAIPNDISVVSYGDAGWYDLIDPPLTTVALPVDLLVRSAVFRLRAMADGADEHKDFASLVLPILKVRGSTKQLI